MSDSKYLGGDQDRRRIDIDDAQALHDWTKALHVSPEDLRRAVVAVGDDADAVSAYLKQRPTGASAAG
nr:DUF3606 domain-containing protein [uncultured Roseateles sp.]